MFLVFLVSSASANKGALTIKLSAIEDGFYDQHPSSNGVPHSSTGNLTLIPSFDPNTEVKWTHAQVSINQLPIARNGDFYSLYISSPSIDRRRVLSFNTSVSWNASNSFIITGSLLHDAILASDGILVEVTKEVDDGIEVHTGPEAYVLQGSNY